MHIRIFGISAAVLLVIRVVRKSFQLDRIFVTPSPTDPPSVKPSAIDEDVAGLGGPWRFAIHNRDCNAVVRKSVCD